MARNLGGDCAIPRQDLQRMEAGGGIILVLRQAETLQVEHVLRL
jgi:hypothetical protein